MNFASHVLVLPRLGFIKNNKCAIYNQLGLSINICGVNNICRHITKSLNHD